MKRRIAGLVLAVAGLAGLGATTATAAPSAQKENFLVVQTSFTKPGTLLGSGPVSGPGKDIVVSDTQDSFVFQAGSLDVTHTPTGGSEHNNPQTCVFTFKEFGTYVVTGGTGAYAGASGSGNYTASGTFTGCGKPTTITVVIQASGPLTLNNV